MIKYKQLTNSDIENYYGKSLPFTVFGYAVYQNDLIIALVGIRKCNGYNLLFSDVKTFNVPKITIWRIAKKLVIMLTEKYKNILSVASVGSERFLESLGFDYAYEWEGKKVYRWLTHLH